jgi:type VI secretion system protein ImpI
MLVLRLFHRNSPGRQIEERPFSGGTLTVGRRATSDWAVDDPDRVLSNDHCKFTSRGRDLFIVDTSTNGVFMNARKERLPRGEPVPIRPGDQLVMGHFTIMIEAADDEPAFDADSRDPWDEAPAPRSASRVTGTPWERDDRGSSGSSKDPFESSLIRDTFDESSIGRGRSQARDTDSPFAGSSRSAASKKPDILPDDDAWETPNQKKAGDWDAPKRGPVGMDDSLIGKAKDWIEPEPEMDEAGFGFDAPFNMPIMRSAEVSSKALDIPTDWAEASSLRGRHEADPFSGTGTGRQPARRPQAAAPVARGDEREPDSRPRRPAAAPPVQEPRSRPAARRPEREPVYEDDGYEDRPAEPRARAAPAPARRGEQRPVERRDPEPRRRTDKAGDEQDLLQAFLEGAKLNPSAFQGVPPEEIMRGLGGVYRQMVLGLGDIMQDRTSVKNEFRMTKTTIGRQDNNPFKFLPPQKVAVDLLRSADEGFLAAEPAVRASFQDVKKHLFCMLAGMRAALTATMQGMEPKIVEQKLKGKSFMTAAGKKAAAWDEFVKFYAQFKKDADDNPESVVNRAFRDAYEKQLQELDGMTRQK